MKTYIRKLILIKLAPASIKQYIRVIYHLISNRSDSWCVMDNPPNKEVIEHNYVINNVVRIFSKAIQARNVW